MSFAIVGFQVSQAIHVAATLGLADHLADGPRTSDELAAATDSHAGSLYRLLRALASVGVFDEDESRRFSLTPMGTLGRPEDIAAGVAYLASDDAAFITGLELYIDGGFMAR